MIEMIESKNGVHVRKINGFLTHSLYDPYKEATKFVKKNIEDVQVHVIYGYGSGFIVEEFLRNNQFNTIYIVIDPFVNINNLKENDYVKYLFLEEIDKISNIYSYLADLSSNVKITCSLNYDKMDPILYKEVLNKIKSFLELNKVNENTVLRYSHMWFVNYLKNLKYKDSSVSNFEKRAKKGVVIASGGPSLTKQLPLLKKYRSNFIVISAGSTTNSLIQEGIIPDIVVSVDGHPINYKHFEHLTFDNNTIFVYSMYNYFKIRELFKKAYYFVDSTGDLIADSLSAIKGEETVIFSGGGSVAHFAFLLGSYISSGPICLIGQDLAYLNGKTHADNNVLGKKLTDEQQKGLITVEGYYGDVVYTDNAFLSMKKSFEKIIKSLENSRSIFNCTEGGALIKGIPNKKFKDFCEDYKDIHDDTSLNLLEGGRSTQQNPLEVSKKLLSKYKEIKSILCDNLKLIKKTSEKKVFQQNILKKLEKNDNKIKKMSEKDVISIAFQAIAIEVQRSFKKNINDSIEEQFKKSIDENIFLYTEMEKIVDIGIKALQENTEELEV